MRQGSPWVTLGEVATFIGGGTPSRINSDYFGGDIPWVKTTDLNNGIISNTEESISSLGLRASSCKIIPPGAVLVAMYGGFNQIGRTGMLVTDSAINQALTAIVPNVDKLDSRFLLEWLNYRVGYWKRFAGSSRKDPNITKGDVASFPVRLLPLSQQSHIGVVLQCWNQAIEKAGRLIQLRIRQRAALVNRVASFSKREVRLGEFLTLRVRQVSKPNEPYWALGIRSHGKGTFQRFVDNPQSIDMEQLYMVRRDDLIINITFAWEGAIALVGADDERCLVSHRFPTYEFDRSVAVPDFVKYIVNRKQFFSKLSLISPGGAGRNRVLNKKDFLNLVVRLPEISEQVQFAQLLNALDRIIDLESLQRQRLKDQKRGLMQKLLSGEWRVKDDEPGVNP